MDWGTPFNTEILFLENYLSSTSAKDFAYNLISADEIKFGGLLRQNIIANDAVVGSLLASWHTVSISVWESCSAFPTIALFLGECAQVCSVPLVSSI